MMNDNKKIAEEKIAILRERSKSGLLNQIINQVTPIQSTKELKDTEEEYRELISSIFDE